MDLNQRPPGPSPQRRADSVPRLWAAWALPMLSWFVHLNASYLLVDWTCRHGAGLLHAVSLICLLLALAGMVLAWRAARVDRERSRFLGRVGLFAGGLFAAVIAMQALTGFLVPPCH
ncbi:MAG: hypothetical protein GTN84_01760 [Hydrogenophaga sp.]|uniref:hypothetical protein n=1 Tax=Hydrogenophaga sp. TaxID=1904254 RepID=UPI001691A657|nr:hypothetical protein [Hydrogenophaga sp.]NIM39877.1 hypothetical protein [Hydrogenophaga sp.]NIN25073.1 hypothetical protein [Hydrogenophaga sp.]NIN29640.1 hypothetical protein [Hydrogenophaga sp.]NIN54112.1 hypothetical protein [Hydrogenophaga sp.]NIO50525.1 hypothetical protein [Hydrogenophaga sp.]